MAITIGGGVSLGGGIAFTPGPAADPYWSSTRLLLPANGSNGATNNTFVDSSTNNFGITRNGDVGQGTFNPFSSAAPYSTANGGSMYFDGSGDYLTLASNAAFNIFGGDMTVECWFYANSLSSSPHLFAFAQDGTNRESIYFNASALTFWTSSAAGNGGRIATSALSLNTWYHMAVVKSGATFTMYLNGAVVGTSTTTQYSTAAQSLQLGTYNSGVYAGDNFNGYISNVRIVKGTAVYTAAFTPSTTPLTAIANTSLLLSGTNAGIIDNTMTNNLVTVDNASISTAQSKWGGSSMYFDGSGDYLTMPPSSNLAFGTGDFTIEMWCYLTATGSQDGVFWEARSSGATSTGFVFNSRPVAGGYKLNIYTDGATNLGATTIPYSTWAHIAVSRSSGSIRLFVNGVVDLTISKANNFSDTPAITIGSSTLYGSSNITGYLNDFRVTKGVARYTSNFSVPTEAFPTQG